MRRVLVAAAIAGIALAVAWPVARRDEATHERAARLPRRAAPPARTDTAREPALPALPAARPAGSDRVRVEGIVLESDGSVASGAFVALAEATRTATADAGGGFTLDVDRETCCTLGARKADRASPTLILDVESGDPGFVTLRLEATAVLDVDIADADTGTPLAGASVEVSGPPRRTLRSGEDGKVRVPGIASGTLHLDVSAETYVERWVMVEVPRGAGEAGLVLRERVELRKGSRIGGRVIDELGAPISKAHVHVRSSDGIFGAAGAWSDASGRWSITAAPRGRMAIEAEADGFVPGGLPEVVVGVEPIDDLVITLSDGLVVRGRAVDTSGRGVPDAEVHVETAGRAAPVIFRDARSGEDGAIELRGLPPAKLRVTARKGRLASEPVLLDLVVSPDAPLELVLVESSISGRVVTAAGDPVGGAVVIAGHAPGPDASMKTVTTRSDNEGRFSFDGLPQGRWLITGGTETLGPAAQVAATTGDRDVVLTLATGARIRGRVTAEDGSPIARFTVNDQPFASRDGTFEVSVRSKGRAELEVRSEGKRTARVEVPLAGAEVDAGTIVLAPAGRITGRVVEEDGTPARGAIVLGGSAVAYLSPGMEQYLLDRGILARVVTGDDGRFALDAIDGDAYVRATAGGRRSETIKARDGERVELRLRRTGTLRVRLELRGRRPDVRYGLKLEQDRWAPCREGLCVVDDATAGDYTAVVSSIHGPLAWTATRVHVAPGETTEHRIDLGPAGAPVRFTAPARVAALVFPGHVEARTLTDALGEGARHLRVELDAPLEGLRPGPYTACAYTPDPQVEPSATPLLCTPFTVPEGGAEVTVELRAP